MPFLFQQRFRLSRIETIGSLILAQVSQNLKLLAEDNSRDVGGEIESYVENQVELFGIKSNGLCKYCSLFHVDLSQVKSGKSKSLQNYLLKTIESNEAFCDVVTSVKLEDDVSVADSSAKNSMQLNRELLARLTNLADISIKNISISELDLFVKECKSLKNLKLVQNDLAVLPADLFDMYSGLMQVCIDNNPVVEIPASLFSMQSLRSLRLSRLNVAVLPDTFLEKLEGWLAVPQFKLCFFNFKFD